MYQTSFQIRYNTLSHNLRKISPLGAIVALVTITHICFGTISARAASNQELDSGYLPIKATMFQRALIMSSHDPVKMFSLIRRGDLFDYDKISLTTLDSLRHKQQINSIVLAAYCLAFQYANGNPKFAKHSSSLPFSTAQYADYQLTLQKSMRCNPKLWLPYMIEGWDLIDKPGQALEGLTLLKKAVDLAPNISITHYYLGCAYTIYDPRFQSFPKAEQEFLKASALHPIMADIPFAQLDLYVLRIPNASKAASAKRAYINELPTRIKLSDWAKKLLSSQASTNVNSH